MSESERARELKAVSGDVCEDVCEGDMKAIVRFRKEWREEDE